MHYPLVVAIVLNWNAPEETIDCVNSLLASRYENFKIIIVDNASTDESLKILRRTFPSICIISSSVNLGYAGGNNLGIKWALENTAEYILILNNDVIVDNLMVSVLVRKIESNSRIGLISGKVFYKDDPKRIFSGAGKFIRWRCTGVNRGSVFGRAYQHDEDCFVNYVSGVLFLARSEVFNNIGLMDEKFFMYFEDLEFSRRVLTKYLISYTPKAIAFHRSGGGTRWSNYSVTYLYYQTRNRILVFENDNIIYQLYVIAFTFLVTIAKSISIIFSFFRHNKDLSKRLIALWGGLRDGIFNRIFKKKY